MKADRNALIRMKTWKSTLLERMLPFIRLIKKSLSMVFILK
jgi:hypothetical protein